MKTQNTYTLTQKQARILNDAIFQAHLVISSQNNGNTLALLVEADKVLEKIVRPKRPTKVSNRQTKFERSR